jgi:NO-binding membrane sensor protein with MHYT domain
MNKIELIAFSILAVISAITAFDFITYVLKASPKSSYLTKRFWIFGTICIMGVVYWYMNGMRFL